MATRTGNDMPLICLGFGYTAQAFVARHGARFSRIMATCRSDASEAVIRHAGGAPVRLQDADNAPLKAALANSNVVLVSAGPDAAGDPFVGVVDAALSATPKPLKILYLSTVGVYGDHDGGWVEETTEPRPTSQRSRWRLAAEQAWLALGRAHGASVQLFRLAGIYGPGQNALENLRAGKAKRLVKPGQVFNRIHVDDIADVLLAAIDRGTAGAIWNVADNEPAPPQDVVTYGARLLSVPPPPEVAFDPAVLSPMARSFYGENKRVSNRAICETLGVALQFPTYREGLSALLAASAASP